MARRFFRKHRAALFVVVLYNLVLFAPVVSGRRVISANDIYYNYPPWSLDRPADLAHAQNPLLVDPPTSYYTLMSLVTSGREAFHWNPYIAAGAPGFGSSAAAVLSPFILLPTLVLPLEWVFTAVLFLKLNVAFLFAYLWLREERMGRLGAAIGAIVIAGSGIYAVRWMWQATNATALYPALLWVVRRTFSGKHTPLSLVTLIAVAYALAGFPSAMAYGAYLTVAYAIYLAIRFRRLPMRAIGVGVVGVALALIIAAPSLVAFGQWILRSGYLQLRAGMTSVSFPAWHWRSFFVPERLGNPASGNWTGDSALGIANNFVEATVYIGLMTLLLAALALFVRRPRSTRAFWIVTAVVAVATMFGARGLASLVGQLPGFKYSMLSRVALLLPLPAGYLAGAGARVFARRRVLVYAIAVVATLDLAIFAAKFQPYLPASEATVPSTPTIDFLRADEPPFRVAPFFDYLWPNSSELFRVEDVRSHFTSEQGYRQLLLRIDRGAWSGKGTYLGFNSLGFAFDDPIAGMLGIRWYIEPRSIDIIKWKTLEKTKAAVEELGTLPFRAGDVLTRGVTFDGRMWAIDVPMTVSAAADDGRLVATLARDGTGLWSRAFSRADIEAMNRIYIPVRPYARAGDRLTLTLRADNLDGSVGRGAAPAGEAPVLYERVDWPVILDRELPDGRIFRNLAELPRFHPVTSTRSMSMEQMLATRDIDFANEAIVMESPSPLPLSPRGGARGPSAQVSLDSYQPARQKLTTDSSAGFFLASSEKLSPELAITIDGKRAEPQQINGVFAGVRVPAGHHKIVFSRIIGRGWWWPAAIAFLLWGYFACATMMIWYAKRPRQSFVTQVSTRSPARKSDSGV